ncbi:FG-GAP repeat protein [Dactylosporangium sp. NPDC000244]|uniref:FG-GAP repeat protein n=1 Tax=Dactylosporangium sp. NPDC000244 TaxID=3154365 RepID=UPI00332E93A6
MWPAGGLWNGFHAITAGDFNGDGKTDIAGVDAAGITKLYTGTERQPHRRQRHVRDRPSGI